MWRAANISLVARVRDDPTGSTEWHGAIGGMPWDATIAQSGLSRQQR